MATKNNRGGYRVGAGRKPLPEPTEQHPINFLMSHLRYLRSLNKSLTLAVRQVIAERLKGTNAKN